MAQFVPGITASAPATRNADPLTDLNLLLSRLQRTILHADAEREARLKESEFERAKAQTNINHARSLLTKIEHDTLSVKIHTRRQSLQTDLVRKRELLDQLSERLSDLAEFAAASTPDQDDEGDTSEGEDILADIIATPSESLESTPPALPTEPDSSAIDTPPSPAAAPIKEKEVPKPALDTIPKPSSQPQKPTTETTSSLRPRRPDAPASQKPSATTSALFGDRDKKSQTTTEVSSISAVATKEAILDHQRAEQDALSESILKLASQLKASSQAFSQALDEDLELVNRAGEGMNKTEARMQTITKRMGALTRMTEGEGWWGRMKLYAIVYGLMVVLVLVVFVLPKLRF
ncbi:hypothetical protein QBC35DRAFT_1348 [Podospora australis]|uniref:Synaptobrevin n=1 Tax=Podospora australis TaxID=1536484 RepID=A0AAN6X478_9PEZI|nr:hypothetical protein QBC35DRAFT_1348 [Podospora australis]